MPADKHIDGYLTLLQAADYMNVTRQAVFIAIKQRGLKAIRLGRQWYLKKEDLDEYLLNKYNRDLRRRDGEYIYDAEKGFFSVNQICKILSKKLGKYSLQHIYYLIRRGDLPAHRNGAAWVIKKEDGIALLEKEMKKLISESEVG